MSVGTALGFFIAGVCLGFGFHRFTVWRARRRLDRSLANTINLQDYRGQPRDY